MIQLQNVQVTYRHRRRPSLRNFNLAIRPGEFVLLTGKSGCGKTTVTRLINGLIPHFFDADLQGEITVGALNTKTASLRDLARKAGSVFQDPRSQFFTLHVRSEIAFPSENYGIASDIMQARISRTAQELELAELLSKSIFALSSGEKQKVAVASVYALEPDMYVLDEPSANLDADGSAQLRAVLKVLKSKGCTVIIAEHRLGYLQGLADRVIFLEDGQLQADFSGQNFFARPDSWFRERGLQPPASGAPPPAAGRRMAAAVPFLQAANISFAYQRDQPVLHAVSLTAGRGEVTGIMGQNGVGKSTLLRILMGLEKAGSGTICLAGRAAGRRERRQRSFYVMQDVDYQLFAPSVWEELLLGGPASPDREVQAEYCLRFFELDDYRECHPAALSGGQKQRLAVALAWMSRAELVFFDEPTSGLDGDNMDKVSRLIRALARQGRCIFVITHDAAFAAATCDTILLMGADGILTSRPEQAGI